MITAVQRRIGFSPCYYHPRVGGWRSLRVKRFPGKLPHP
jgi:hypothetical protein